MVADFGFFAFEKFAGLGTRPYRRLEIPEDVVSLYKTVNTPEFQERRRIASRLVSCPDASRDLYGSVPVSVIRRILEQELDAEISETKILSLFNSLPSDCKYSVYDRETGRIHYRRIQDTELAELLHEQGGASAKYLSGRGFCGQRGAFDEAGHPYHTISDIKSR